MKPADGTKTGDAGGDEGTAEPSSLSASLAHANHSPTGTSTVEPILTSQVQGRRTEATPGGRGCTESTESTAPEPRQAGASTSSPRRLGHQRQRKSREHRHKRRAAGSCCKPTAAGTGCSAVPEATEDIPTGARVPRATWPCRDLHVLSLGTAWLSRAWRSIRTPWLGEKGTRTPFLLF